MIPLLLTTLGCGTKSDTGTHTPSPSDTASDTAEGVYQPEPDTLPGEWWPPHGHLVTGSWTQDKAVFDIIDIWEMGGSWTDCSGCLYSWDASFSGQKTGAAFDTNVLINPIEGYPGYGYAYGGSDFWGIAFDYYDHVVVSNYSVYLRYGVERAPYLYQGYFYFYE